ncbi:hypothetical protein FB45DRAFT_1057120 [Roridomyces roridus]|uniref:Uncharacterized protein n=1 Tax=Roridomyces roridus TaxID=1738132 RepID=A0AAD7FP45_9AGAR|nr:hypothetical protein FB45DRAFT_1057120 [Roridomyces roridus]
MARLRLDSLQSIQSTNSGIRIENRLNSLDSPTTRPDAFIPTTYSSVSSFRSPQFEVLLYSASTVTSGGYRDVPAYGVDDVVRGKIIVDPSCREGRIALTVSGTVTYTPRRESTSDKPKKERHIFYSSSSIIHIAAPTESYDPPRSAFRQVFSFRRRSGRARAESGLYTRAHPFAFDLANDERSAGGIIPSTSSAAGGAPSMPFEVTYHVMASWAPLIITEQPSVLTIPIIIQPESEFHAVNGFVEKPKPWLEIPLKGHRSVPFQCAVTLPEPMSFSRTSSVPYFVVFTTAPRSKTLAREIAADATISISVSSQLRITEVLSPFAKAATFVVSTTDISESSESRSSLSSRFKPKFDMKRIKHVRSSKSSLWASASQPSQPSLAESDGTSTNMTARDLPPLPPRLTTFSAVQTIYSKICLGFPKRPRQAGAGSGSHPSLATQRSLPDGLHKDCIPLHPRMLASFQRNGVSLKYYLEVSVSIGQDELRANIPIRIT